MIRAIGKNILVETLSKRMWGFYHFQGAVLVLCGWFSIYIRWRSRMTAEEKLKVLRNELSEQGYAENTAMFILIQEKIAELEWCRIGSIASEAIREHNKTHRPNS